MYAGVVSGKVVYWQTTGKHLWPTMCQEWPQASGSFTVFWKTPLCLLVHCSMLTAWVGLALSTFSSCRSQEGWSHRKESNRIGLFSCTEGGDGPRQFLIKMWRKGTSLVVQWLRICLPVQGTQVWSLVRKVNPTCLGQWSLHIATRVSLNAAMKTQLCLKKKKKMMRKNSVCSQGQLRNLHLIVYILECSPLVVCS